MNVFFGCQGSITEHFIFLDTLLSKSEHNYKSHFWIGNKYEFKKNKFGEYFKNNKINFFKEWDFINDKGKINLEERSYVKNKFKNLNLWNIIIADRRLMYGSESKYKQKYSPKYTFYELQNIIYHTLATLDKYIITNKIDLIVTFVPSCFGTFILNTIAEKNKIKLRQLRASKIEDVVLFSDTIKATPKFIAKKYDLNIKNYPNIKNINQGKEYLNKLVNFDAKYSGSERIKKKFNNKLKYFNIYKYTYKLLNYFKYIDTNNKINFYDYLFHKFFISKFKKYKIKKLIKSRMINLNKDTNRKVLFYPLNSEPEIAISIHSRNHQNQIETLRRISQSIPLDWILVVKEHPRSIGIRSINYYKKILEIPNLYFYNNNETSKYCIKNCDAVCTLTGFIGFEAIVQKKPVILLGDSFYSSLPSTMVKRVKNMEKFYDDFIYLIDNYKYQEINILSLICAHFEYGKKIDIYKTILNKPVKKITNNLDYEGSIINLKKLLLDSIDLHG